jgi:hypothetical protein
MPLVCRVLGVVNERRARMHCHKIIDELDVTRLQLHSERDARPPG